MEGKVDFIGFSYYMSWTSGEDITQSDGNMTTGGENPYLKKSEWGCIDLISASTGEISKRYGMIYVDKDDDGNGTLKRYKKDSFYWYKKVIENNGENL